MSNVIKANFIYQGNKEKRIIDSDSRSGSFIPMNLANVQTLQDFPQELGGSEVSSNVLFSNRDKEKLKEETLQEAKKEAEEILEQAQQQALTMRDHIFEEARKEGYLKGIQEGQQEIFRKESELQEKEHELEGKYQEMVQELEPEFVGILIALLEKITGVIVEDKREIIVHLVEKAMKNLGRCENYKIRVSQEDFWLLEDNKEKLYAAVDQSAKIEILGEENFVKNQCVIEGDSTIVDCSLDVQMKNLTDTLRYLSI